MPELDPADLEPRAVYFLLTSLVVPRPIAWVSSLSAEGARNLAPHSYFNVVSSKPPVVHFTSTGVKDSLRNVRATGEFVVNIVSEDLVEPMNLTATDFPPDEDEFTWAKLDAAESVVVGPPRVAAARAALECRLRDILSIGNGNMVFGDVVHVHVDDAIWSDGRIDPELLEPVGRLAGWNYAPLRDVVRIPRPSWDPATRQPRIPR